MCRKLGVPSREHKDFVGRDIETDILAEGALDQAGEVDAVVHLAAETGVGQSMYEVDRYRRVNVEGTAAVAEWCGRHSTPLVFFSSRAVYGEGLRDEDGALRASREDDPHRPVSFYGETKSRA